MSGVRRQASGRRRKITASALTKEGLVVNFAAGKRYLYDISGDGPGSSSEEGSYLRLVDFCITQLKAESNKEEGEKGSATNLDHQARRNVDASEAVVKARREHRLTINLTRSAPPAADRHDPC